MVAAEPVLLQENIAMSVFSNPEDKILKERLRQIFENQLAVLTERGAPLVAINYLQSKWQEVMARGANFSALPDNFVFLPVIPFVFVGLPVLVSFVRNNGRSGATFLDPRKVWDLETVPSMPYYIFGVDGGNRLLNRPSGKAEKSIVLRHRRRLTAAETISLAIQTDVLKHHNLDALGSRCWNGEAFPGLCRGDIAPELIACRLNEPNERWGAPSCVERF